MIIVPKTVVLTKKLQRLIDEFNELEEKLQYPNCEDDEDAKRILVQFEREMIMQGIV